MANAFGKDILIQTPDPNAAAAFYVEQLAFTITGKHGRWMDLHGDNINLFIEEGPALGPVLEVTVDDVEKAKERLMASGCEVVKNEPDFPRCYVKDPYGLIYNLTMKSARQKPGANSEASGSGACDPPATPGR